MAITLKYGDHGEYVERLQSALIAMGFDLGPGRADGKFGAGTRAAVKGLQTERGLPETGIADPDTIAALDLDPNTLDDLIEIDTPVGAEEIDERAAEVIANYVDARTTFEVKMIATLDRALGSFEGVLEHASTEEARSDVMGSVISKLFENLVKDVLGEVAKVNPWAKLGSYFLDAAKAASDEMKRAEAARHSVLARDWIEKQRRAINQAHWGLSRPKKIEAEIKAELSRTDERDALLSGLETAIAAYDDSGYEDLALLSHELTLCETWINAFFTGPHGPGQGYVVVILDTDHDPWELKGTRVLAPYADRVKDRLGELLALSADSRFAQIRAGLRPFALDLRVNKFVVFGHSGSSFLEADAGALISPQILKEAYAQWGAFVTPENERVTTPEDELSRLRMQAALGGDNRLELDLTWA
jgi:hypothetical protein